MRDLRTQDEGFRIEAFNAFNTVVYNGRNTTLRDEPGEPEPEQPPVRRIGQPGPDPPDAAERRLRRRQRRAGHALDANANSVSVLIVRVAPGEDPRCYLSGVGTRESGLGVRGSGLGKPVSLRGNGASCSGSLPLSSTAFPSPEPRAPSPESRAPSPEPRAPSPEPRVPSPEPRAPSPEPRAPSPEPDLSPSELIRHIEPDHARRQDAVGDRNVLMLTGGLAGSPSTRMDVRPGPRSVTANMVFAFVRL